MTYDVMGNRLKEFNDGSTPYIMGYSPNLAYVYDTAHAQASQNRDVLLQEQGLTEGSGPSYPYYKNTFSYDPAYNLTTFSARAISRTYGANTDNQLTNLGFAFDGNGNPTTYQGATFSFDPEDRLASISSPAFAASYDGDGLRATKTVNGKTTYFLYDGTEPVIEETFNGAVASISAVNTFGADGWRARYYPGGTFYTFLFNPQGSMTQKENATSYSEPHDNYHTGPYSFLAYSNAVYEAYGVANVPEQAPEDGIYSPNLPPPAQIDPVGFGGQWGYYTDRETGLVLMGHRYYDPGTGRFLTRDPLGYGGGMNLYGYADGNPVNESDPSGFGPDPDDPTGLPGDNDGHWGATTSAPGMNEGFKHGTSQNNARRSMTNGLGSIFRDTALGMLNPEGRLAEGAMRALQAGGALKWAARGLITRRLTSHVERAIPLARANLSPQQVVAINKGTVKEGAFLGQRIDQIAKEAVGNDWLLRPFIKVTHQGKYGPDFHSPYLQTWWDITTNTAREVANHRRKYTANFGHGIFIFWK